MALKTVPQTVAIRTERRPANVLDTSRGWLRWAGGPQPSESGTHVDLPDDSPWEGVVRRAEAHLHATQQIINVQRYASGYEADVGYQSGEHHRVTGDFVSGGKLAALGVRVRRGRPSFHIDVPEHDLLPDPTEPVRLRGFRAACFSEALNRDIALCDLASVFQREQLERSYLACLADEALRLELDLPNARLSIGTTIHDRLVDAVDALFSTADEFGAPARGLDELKDLARSSSVIARLDQAAERLWAPLTPRKLNGPETDSLRLSRLSFLTRPRRFALSSTLSPKPSSTSLRSVSLGASSG